MLVCGACKNVRKVVESGLTGHAEAWLSGFGREASSRRARLAHNRLFEQDLSIIVNEGSTCTRFSGSVSDGGLSPQPPSDALNHSHRKTCLVTTPNLLSTLSQAASQCPAVHRVIYVSKQPESYSTQQTNREIVSVRRASASHRSSASPW